jgi:hypothetical protein
MCGFGPLRCPVSQFGDFKIPLNEILERKVEHLHIFEPQDQPNQDFCTQPLAVVHSLLDEVVQTPLVSTKDKPHTQAHARVLPSKSSW